MAKNRKKPIERSRREYLNFESGLMKDRRTFSKRYVAARISRRSTFEPPNP